MTPSKVCLAMASMGKPETNVGELCKELGISRQALYRHVSTIGDIRPDGRPQKQVSDGYTLPLTIGFAGRVHRLAPCLSS